ncbi:MAG: hypothetical protein ACREEM_33125, partial [Blastocatellia bacterium]
LLTRRTHLKTAVRRLLNLAIGTQPQELALAQDPRPRNEAMFAALQRSAERLKDVPVSGSTEDTLKIIREGRAGAMYGYEVRHEGGGKE